MPYRRGVVVIFEGTRFRLDRKNKRETMIPSHTLAHNMRGTHSSLLIMSKYAFQRKGSVHHSKDLAPSSTHLHPNEGDKGSSNFIHGYLYRILIPNPSSPQQKRFKKKKQLTS